MSTSLMTEIETGFEDAVPLLAVVNSLAATYAGNIYRQVAGTVENLASWTTSHPQIIEAVNVIEPLVQTLVPGSAAAIGTVNGGINVAQHVLGALGQLMASDPTVAGPQAAAVAPAAPAAPMAPAAT